MRSMSAVLLVLVLLQSGFAVEKLPRVPAGFTIEKITTPDLVKHPMMAGFDGRGRLFVACSSGKNLRAADLMKNPPNFIKMLEDTNGDGKFDKATVFADKMTLPMGALWYRGALYVASPPHIWKLEDTNGDGVADKRTILVDKFGFSGNAASVHGCFLGPTGRIYWCDGRHGHEFVDKKGNVSSKGKAARIFSCKPDGSDVRVHCGGGMDNPVEIDFTETGEMIGSVNILIGRPRGDCLVHWVEGGVYPRYDQQQCLDEFKRTGDPLPPMTNLGHVAVSGMMRYRSDQFGKAYQNNIFTTLFNTHKVIRSELNRSGSTFTTTEHEFLQSDDPDFHPTDVLEDADGSLLVIDTGGWFRIGCPVSKVAKPDIHGAIYRIRKTGAHKVADPRGLKLHLDRRKPQDLVRFLGDARPAVRDAAVDRLAQQWIYAIDALQDVVEDRKKAHSITSRRNAIWALSRIGNEKAIQIVTRVVGDRNETIRIAAVVSLGNFFREWQAESAVTALAARVSTDPAPAVRREVARSLTRLGPEDAGFSSRPRTVAIRALFTALGGRLPVDRVMEHTIIHALIQIADRDATLPFLKDKNPAVRRAALIALDQMDGGNLTRELATPLLDTDDPALQKTALAVIAKHPGWAKETLSLVRKWFTEPGSVNPDRADTARLSALRGFLVAQSADKAVQSLVAELVQSPNTDAAKRLLLLEVIQRSSLRSFPDAWKSAIRTALKSDDRAVQLQAVRIVGERELPFVTEVQPIALDPKFPIALRAEALLAVGPQMRMLSDENLLFFSNQIDTNFPPLTRLTIARAVAAAPLADRQLVILANRFWLADPLTAPVLLRAFEKSKSEKVGLALVKTLSNFKSVKSLSAAELNRLLQKYPTSVRTAAKPLLAKLGVNPAEQERHIAKLLKLSDGGDAVRGRDVFFSKKAACAGCHTVAGQGGKVGPDLTTIGTIRQPRDLVEALAYPSASLARGFRTYIVVTDRGKIHTGVITRETSTEIVLRDATLAEIRIPRGGIEAIRESPVSLMPKGLDKTLTADELRNLLAYLRSRKIADAGTPKVGASSRPDVDKPVR